MSVEDMLVKMNEDHNPPVDFTRFLWVSRPQPSKRRAKQLAELAVSGYYPGDWTGNKVRKARVEMDCYDQWRGVVYAGRRSRREVAKAGE